MTYAHLVEMPGSEQGAARILPLLFGLLPPIRSVVDFGGGSGTWLRVCQQLGVESVSLVDVPQVEPHLLVPRTSFHPANLAGTADTWPAPLQADLALCLECAEHLPAARAEDLVAWLTKAAPYVLFSAAIPGQLGTNHIHLQPPDYWAALFRARGYVRRDLVRGRLMADPSIPWWYRQNIVLFVAPAAASHIVGEDFLPEDFVVVHRQVFRELWRADVSGAAAHLLTTLKGAIQRRLGW